MGYENNDVHNEKEPPNKNIKIKMETSQDKNNDLKKNMNNKDIHKVKDKDIRKRTRMSQSKDSDLTKESENEDAYKVKYKDKYIEKKKEMPQDENSDSIEKSENEDIHKVKYRNKHIRKKIKMSQNSDSDLVKELDNKDAYQIKCKDKDMRSMIKISQNGSDSMEESENKHAHIVKENEDIGKRIKISQNKNDNQKNKYVDEAGSKDEDVGKEYCGEATHLVHKVKHKDKNIQNEKNTSQDEDSNSMEVSENKGSYKVKYKDDNILNKKKVTWDEDNDSMEKSENENARIKCKDKDIKSKVKMSQDDNDSTEESENKDAHKVKENEDIEKRIKISQNKNDNQKNKYADEAGFNEDVEKEYCVEATHLVHKIKYKSKNIQNEKKTQDEGNNSIEVSKNKDVCEVKYKDDNIQNVKKVSQDEDSDLTEKSKNKNAQIKCKNEDIGSNVKMSQDNNSIEESKNKNAHKAKRLKNKDIRKWVEMSQNNDNNLIKKAKNINVEKVECKSENIENGVKISQNEDSDLKKELKNEDTIKYEDIRNRRKTLQRKNHDSKKFGKSKYIRKVENESGDEDIDENCSEATYLARQMASAQRLYHTEIIKLYKLKVQLRHTVPPQHEIETRAGSHMPTRNEIKEFEKIIPLKKGSYSFEEDNIIANNWKTFCKIHNWSVNETKPFLQLRIGNMTYMRNTKERRKFVQFLADGLPERTLYSVYHRFKNLYENNLQRRFKPEEDEMIIDHLENNPSLEVKRKYVDLAKVLQRTRHSIWRRYRILKKKRVKKEDN